MPLYEQSINLQCVPFKLTDLNTAPVRSTDEGKLGEIRICLDGFYIFTADGWGKVILAILPSSSALDEATLDFQARATRNGGTFSKSATIPSIDSFIKSLKADGIWELLIDVGIYAGDNLAAALTKLKYPSSAVSNYVNHGFGETDYEERNGLRGGFNKYLDPGISADFLNPNSAYIAGYLSGDFSVQTPSFFGTPIRSGDDDNFKFYINYQGNCYSGLFFEQVLGIPTPVQGGFLAVCKENDSNAFFQCNDAQSSVTVSTTARAEEILFFQDRGGYFQSTLKFSCIASALSTGQSLLLKNRVLALQQALGRA